MEEDKLVGGLQQLHDDIKELTRVIRENYEGAKSQYTSMRRLYLTVITLAFLAMFLYPWIYRAIFRIYRTIFA